MKNLFLEKNIVQKLIIAIVIVILFNFTSPTLCNAKGFGTAVGGALLVPVMELIMHIGDAILNILQTSLLTDLNVTVPATSSETRDVGWGILKVVGIILCVAVVVVAVVVTGGAAAAIVTGVQAAGGTLLATATAIATQVGAYGGTIVGALAIGVGFTAGAITLGASAITDFKGEYDLPTIVYTPFAIFSGIVPLFDINFFKPSTKETKVVNVPDLFATESAIKVENNFEKNEVDDETMVDVQEKINNAENYQLFNYIASVSTWGASFTYYYDYSESVDIAHEHEKLSDSDANLIKNQIRSWIKDGVLFVSPAWLETSAENVKTTNTVDENLQYISGETSYYFDFWKDETVEIEEGIAGTASASKRKKIDITSSDYVGNYDEIFTTDEYGYGMEYTVAERDDYNYANSVTDKNITIEQNMTNYGIDRLKKEVNTLYTRLCGYCDEELEKLDEARAVKTFQKSSASVLQDTVASWYYHLRDLALVCLLIILIYIGIRMVLSSTAPEKAKYKQMIMNWVVALCILLLLHLIMIVTLTITEKITQALTGSCDDILLVPLPKNTSVMGANADRVNLDVEYEDESGNKRTSSGILTTNFVGYIRLYAGIYSGSEEDVISIEGIGYIMIYIMLIVQTCMFTWVYGKRVVYMAFLTIIAPLVAITYPIDKIGDGKSQAFDMWLKEYIFNALLQPIHLLIYTVVCGTTLDLMCDSPIYGIVALAFIVPAEKFIRKMFGFEKAQTPSALTGAAGAALAMTGIQRIGNLIRPDGKDDRDADKEPKLARIRTANEEQQSNMSKSAERGRNKVAGIRIVDVKDSKKEGDSEEPDEKGKTPPAGENPTQPEGVDVNPVDTEDETSPEGGDINLADAEDETPEEVGAANPADTAGETPEKGGAANPADTAGETPEEGETANPADAEDKTPLKQTSKKEAETFTARGKRAILSMYDMQRDRIEKANTAKKWARRRRKIRRAAIGGAFGIGAGMAMAATKLAMGANAGDVITTTTAGAVAGYGIGSKGTQKVQEFEKMDKTRESLRDGWLTGEELKDFYDKEARDKAKKDPDTRAVFREAFPDNWEEILYGKKVDRFKREPGWYDYCLDYGLTDPEAIAAAYKQLHSDEFNAKYSGNGITEEERKAIALQAGIDIQRYGDVRNDYKKRTEMQSMKKTLARENENVQRAARQAVEIDKANQKAETEKINRDQAALNAEMVADADLQAEKKAMDELRKAEESARKEIEDNEAKVAKEAEELARKEAELAQLQSQINNSSRSGVLADYDKDIQEQERIIMSTPDDSERQIAIAQKQNLEEQKRIAKQKLDEESVELRTRKNNLDREIKKLKNSNARKNSDARKQQLEDEIKKKREAAEAAQQAAKKIREEKYKARQDDLKKRRTANNKPIKSYDERLDEMADSMAKNVMEQYYQAMDQHDIITG